MENSFNNDEKRIMNLVNSLQQSLDTLDKFDVILRTSLLDEKFMTDADLSEALKIDRRTLKRYRNAGLIPYLHYMTIFIKTLLNPSLSVFNRMFEIYSSPYLKTDFARCPCFFMGIDFTYLSR